MSSSDKDGEPITIKKYANRRLYNTDTSSYVTLEHLADMVKEGKNFAVTDAKTGEDITRSVLTQIIFEQENKGNTLLPVPFLRQLISFYGEGMEQMVPNYLQSSMEMFVHNQEKLKDYFSEQLDPNKAIASIDGMTRQNMAFFEKAIEMMQPFNLGGEAGEAKDAGGADGGDIDQLKQQMQAMQAQLDSLAKKK